MASGIISKTGFKIENNLRVAIYNGLFVYQFISLFVYSFICLSVCKALTSKLINE